MIKKLFTAATCSFLLAGCAQFGSTSGEPAEQKLKRYQANIEGLWKWKEVPDQTLLLSKGLSLYIINGKPDRDTGRYYLSLENPNPKAAYLKMAEVFSAGRVVFFRNEKNPTADHTVANRKKAYAILGMNDHFIQMIDTENGTIWEFMK